MKRQILILVSVLALLVAGAAFAQSTLNTTAPGPTQQAEPGQTNNNLPNPGNPVPSRPTDNQPVTEQGTVEGTAAESAARTQGQGSTTGTTTGTTGNNLNQQNTTGTMGTETEQGEGMDVDVDTGNRASGAVDVDVNSQTDSDTDASGVNETGDMTGGQYSGGDSGSLPETASELPSVALMGLLFLGAAFALRAYQKRNA
jgi:cobalamin biosynthesis Mg chelatase CobN